MPLEILYGLGAVALVAALAYATLRTRNRNRANDGIREEATRQLYDNPAGYEHGGKQKLDASLRPEK